MSVHMSMPVDGTRTPEEDRLLGEMRQQTVDHQAVYPPGRYTVELELDCPVSVVPEPKEAVVYHGDRAVTVFGPLDITLLDEELDHAGLAQAVVGDLVVGLFRWDFRAGSVTIRRFGAAPGHLARMTDAVPAPTAA
ncbi:MULTISPECIES: hypothetical protein [Streptomyces]|uniref:hypothetical protein n=1 Tax=Streptomyces TaxID=1883 RepID=UPI0004CD32F4|nr:MULTISPECIES: hypothetical protein [Streptomyces]